MMLVVWEIAVVDFICIWLVDEDKNESKRYVMCEMLAPHTYLKQESSPNRCFQNGFCQFNFGNIFC